MQARLIKKQNQFNSATEKLNIVSPLATLTRGYSITTNKDGKVISDQAQIKDGELVKIRLANGELTANITKQTD